MIAEILSIGDEITSGQKLDTNSQWLAQRMEEIGIQIVYHTTVADETTASALVFRQALERADFVVASGGLGPTEDDLTRYALALVLQVDLELHPELVEHIRGLFQKRNRPMPVRNEVQASLPRGTRVIPNPIGTAPGFSAVYKRMDGTSSYFYALPGVPAELKEMWKETVIHEIESKIAGGKTICRRTIQCFGAGESQIEAMLPGLIARGRQPTVGITASGGTISLRLAVEASSEEEGAALLQPTIEVIKNLLGDLVFSEENESLQEVVFRELAARQKTLVILSNGNGLAGEWMSEVDPAGTVFRGAILSAHEKELSLPFQGLDQGKQEKGKEVGEPFLKSGTSTISSLLGESDLLLFLDIPREEGVKEMEVFLYSSGGERKRSFPYSHYPQLSRTLAAKNALNFLRLELRTLD